MHEANCIAFAEHLDRSYESFRVEAFKSRRFLPETLHKVIDEIASKSASLISVKEVGKSFKGRPIRLLTVGHGRTFDLLWSQMHGDESTATMANRAVSDRTEFRL